MDTESNKRKLSHDQEDDDINEEEKIEQFFALIKSIREARDRLMNGSDHAAEEADDQNKRKKRKLDDEVEEELEEEKKKKKKQKALVLWEPSFQYEDFIEGARDHHHQFIKNKNNNIPPPPLMMNFAVVGSSQSRETETTHEKNEENIKEGIDLNLSL